ncbi:MAG: hypothetical protein IJT94_07530, partial [Oscillibacter sp.]|nr:hypothetical protein [Oscillibacter sp.]
WNQFRDRASRIAPALFFQPHFPNMGYHFVMREGNTAVLSSRRMDEIHQSNLLSGFPYIKTFTPLRRFTTSFGGSMRFMLTYSQDAQREDAPSEPRADSIVYRVMNRSFMADPDDRLFRDSVIVRLEDGKLNPAATFTRLAAFLDLPYTQSMTCCSERGVRDTNPTEDPDYAVGFSLASLNRDYSRYMNEAEQTFLEFAFRDACAFYGYDFQFYDGAPMDAERLRRLVEGFATQDRLLGEDWDALADSRFHVDIGGTAYEVTPETPAEERERLFAARMEEIRRIRQAVGGILAQDPQLVTEDGRPLRMIPLLESDPALLDGPVYR